MRKALITATVLLLGTAGQATAAASFCPVRAQGEVDSSYAARAHDTCEARWSDVASRGTTGGRTHDRYVGACSSKCAGDRVMAGGMGDNNQLLLVGGVLLAAGAIGGVAAAASSGSHSAPASP